MEEACAFCGDFSQCQAMGICCSYEGAIAKATADWRKAEQAAREGR